MTFDVAPYEPADREAYLGLLREAWGERAMSGDEFDWWFGRNPTGSVISVARMDGRVVGAAAHSLLPMVVNGQRATASWSLHAVTHCSARGRGVFAELDSRNEREAADRGAALALTFPNDLTARVFLGPTRLDGDRAATGLGSSAAGAGARPGRHAARSTARRTQRRTGRTTSCATVRSSTGGSSRLAEAVPGSSAPTAAATQSSGRLVTAVSRRRCSRISSAARGTCCAARYRPRAVG